MAQDWYLRSLCDMSLKLLFSLGVSKERMQLYLRFYSVPFQFKFSVCLSFAMLINKTQRQNFTVSELYLKKSCFTHRQFYIRWSRDEYPQNHFIYTLTGKTKNIVCLRCGHFFSIYSYFYVGTMLARYNKNKLQNVSARLEL